MKDSPKTVLAERYSVTHRWTLEGSHIANIMKPWQRSGATVTQRAQPTMAAAAKRGRVRTAYTSFYAFPQTLCIVVLRAADAAVCTLGVLAELSKIDHELQLRADVIRPCTWRRSQRNILVPRLLCTFIEQCMLWEYIYCGYKTIIDEMFDS
jgi:hypothetical protein